MSELKENILHILVDGEGRYFSGNDLAAQLGVSRNAVWKAVKQLQNTGYRIDSVTNKGYTFVSDDNTLSEACIRKSLHTKQLGSKIHIFPAIDSTNKKAKSMAGAGAPNGTVIIAETQSGGHGRYGRPFFSPEKSGIYMSVLLRPHMLPEDALLLTSCAAVAVAEAIESLADVSVQIKWVNDLLIHQKKICGILTEAGIGFENGVLDYVVIGIGVNTGAVTFPDELADIATSIENESGCPISRNRLIAEILNALEHHIATMNDKAFLEESRRRSILIGQNINVITMNETYPAKAVAIDDHGFLIVEADGRRFALNSGEVSTRLI